MSEEELFKQMELGKVYAKDVLPLVAKEMRNVANSGGALEEKYKTTRVAQGRFFNQLELAQNKIFKSGFDEGLAGFFNNLSETLKDNQSVMEDAGEAFGMFFKAMTGLVRILSPLISAIVRLFNSFGQTLKFFYENPLAGTVTGLGALGFAFKGLFAQKGLLVAFGVILRKVFFGPMAAITAIIAGLDEIRAFFDADVVGVFDSMDDSYEKAQYDAARRRRLFGFSQKGDDELMAAYEGSNEFAKSRMMRAEDSKLGRLLGNKRMSTEELKNSPLSNLDMDTFLSNSRAATTLRAIDRFSNPKDMDYKTLAESKGFIQNVTINVDGSKDPAATAKAVKQELQTVFTPAYGGR